MVTSFQQMVAQLEQEAKAKKAAGKALPRVVAVCPTDEATRYALGKATELGLCTVTETNGDTVEASRQAVDAIREGRGELIMKGHLNTDVLLRAMLDRERGILRPGSVLTHVSACEVAAYPKLLFLTDPAVIPYPTLEQREAQVGYIVSFAHSFGVSCPRIALLHCSEKMDVRHFPFLEQYTQLKQMAADGKLGRCIVDGPMDVRSACSPEAMAAKDQQSPIGGEADALIFPDIEAGNLFYKTIAFFAHGQAAGVFMGTQVPVVASSRADSGEAKFLALCVGLRLL